MSPLIFFFLHEKLQIQEQSVKELAVFTLSVTCARWCCFSLSVMSLTMGHRSHAAYCWNRQGTLSALPSALSDVLGSCEFGTAVEDGRWLESYPFRNSVHSLRLFRKSQQCCWLSILFKEIVCNSFLNFNWISLSKTFFEFIKEKSRIQLKHLYLEGYRLTVW
jgi:hypothetical protein